MVFELPNQKNAAESRGGALFIGLNGGKEDKYLREHPGEVEASPWEVLLAIKKGVGMCSIRTRKSDHPSSNLHLVLLPTRSLYLGSAGPLVSAS